MRKLVILLLTLALFAGMASCADTWHGLTIASTEGGSVNTPGEGPFDLQAGTVVDLIATPDAGHRFVSWTGDAATIADVEAAETTITISGNYEITANFEKVYELTVSSSEGGSVTTPGEGVFLYAAGTVVSLVASPASGYRFVDWTGDVNAVANVNSALTTMTLDGDYKITANFVAQYVLTTSSTEGGRVVAPGEGAFCYAFGTVVDLMAEAHGGYKFLNWIGDVETLVDPDAACTKITVNENYAVTANFLQEHIYLDKIGPGLWGLGTGGEGVEAVVTDDGVVVSFAADPRDDPEAEPIPGFVGGGRSTYALAGDFDIRMSYELVLWPQGSGVRVGLALTMASDPGRYVILERVGFGRNDFLWVEAREVYLVHSDNWIHGITPSSDLSGTLRIRREGPTVTCYYDTPNGWHMIYESMWSTEDVHIGVSAWSHERHFGGKVVTVLLRTVQIV